MFPITVLHVDVCAKVFPGQKLVVPYPMSEDDAFQMANENRLASQATAAGGSDAPRNG